LVQKLEFTTSHSLPQPVVGGLVQDREAIEELERELWKRIYVLRQRVQQTRRNRCQRERKDGAAHEVKSRAYAVLAESRFDLRDSGDGRAISKIRDRRIPRINISGCFFDAMFLIGGCRVPISRVEFE
jgi:hypothetical protein